jgi:hypothetical protein
MSSGRDVGLKRPNLRPKPVNVQCRWYQASMAVLSGPIQLHQFPLDTMLINNQPATPPVDGIMI